MKNTFQCVTPNPQGTLTAHFGYTNANGVVVTIPYGTKNAAPRDTSGTRPTAFFPGAAPQLRGRDRLRVRAVRGLDAVAGQQPDHDVDRHRELAPLHGGAGPAHRGGPRLPRAPPFRLPAVPDLRASARKATASSTSWWSTSSRSASPARPRSSTASRRPRPVRPGTATPASRRPASTSWTRTSPASASDARPADLPDPLPADGEREMDAVSGAGR